LILLNLQLILGGEGLPALGPHLHQKWGGGGGEKEQKRRRRRGRGRKRGYRGMEQGVEVGGREEGSDVGEELVEGGGGEDEVKSCFNFSHHLPSVLDIGGGGKDGRY